AGRQLQHQLFVEAHGSGTANYVLSREIGRLLHLTTTQNLDFAIRASGRTNRFREVAKEEFNPVPSSTTRSGITRHIYEAGFFQPSGSSVAARSGALKVSFTSSLGI